MNVKDTSGKEKTLITLAGELSIYRAAELISLLKQALDDNQETTVAIREVTSLDLSCLQVLCAAHRTAHNLGKSLKLELPLPEVFQEAVKQAGFTRSHGCAFSPNTSCLCCQGGE